MTSPFDFLLELERQSMEHAAGLPRQQETRQQWVGIGFRVGDFRLTAPMDQVQEIMPLPDVARIPGVKSWTLGIANVRGNLIPMFDLHGFLFGTPLEQAPTHQVLVCEHNDVTAGLLVDEVLGLKYFYTDDREAPDSGLPEPFRPYVDGRFPDAEADDEAATERGAGWHIFSLHQLTESPGFLRVSL